MENLEKLQTVVYVFLSSLFTFISIVSICQTSATLINYIVGLLAIMLAVVFQLLSKSEY